MYNNKKILAVIPARGGSKGIPSKNIIEIKGKPLIEYSIECGKKSKYIDRTIISTDSELIKEIAVKCGGDVPFMRPKELAADGSKTIDCLVHAVETLKLMGEEYDYLILLQNTVPLRKTWQVDEAIEKIFSTNERSLVSVTEVEQHPILMRTIDENGIVKNLLHMNSTMRRQDFPKFYKVNGAIYIQKIDREFNLETSLNDGKLAYIMEKQYSVDIDDYIDLKIVEYYLEKEKEEEMKKLKF
ncbi:acylneuraminate cytidylyltransferase family protein [Fusobacterium sp.]|uniref:acylneuraminate cytidylyltransferase family protein n=1 Tax=Fusobacterium sp. TaxID=68766 RepID=UPI00260FD6E9|nr:acylneuraminate cytidylyltransferase family protein [Fusobacterium sp.]